MKKILLFIVLLLNCTIMLWSQTQPQTKGRTETKPPQLRCATPSSMPDFAANMDRTGIARTEADPIRIKVYVVNFLEFTNYSDDYWIKNEIQLMNNFFNTHNICFELIGYRTVDDDSMLNMNLENPNDLARLQTYRVPNVLTIFLHSVIYDSEGYLGGTAYNIPNSYFSLAVDNMNGYSGAHEAGHCLGLFHTFHGNPDVEDGPGTCWENVNGTNAGSCGDYVTDTRADPWGLTGNRITSNCTYTGTAVDANGETYSNLPLDNAMNYWGVQFDQCIIKGFTPGQAERARLAAFNPFGPLITLHVDQSNITQTGGTVTNGRLVRATIGTVTLNDYTLTNTNGGYTAKRVTLTPGSSVTITSAGNNFLIKTGTCQ